MEVGSNMWKFQPNVMENQMKIVALLKLTIIAQFVSCDVASQLPVDYDSLDMSFSEKELIISVNALLVIVRKL
jgi:hypothetical protein